MVISPKLGRASLDSSQFGKNLCLARRKSLCDWREMSSELGILFLLGQSFRPVPGKPVMAVTVVGLANLARGGPTMVEDALRRLFNGIAKDSRFLVAFGVGEEDQAFAKSSVVSYQLNAQGIQLRD